MGVRFSARVYVWVVWVSIPPGPHHDGWIQIGPAAIFTTQANSWVLKKNAMTPWMSAHWRMAPESMVTSGCAVFSPHAPSGAAPELPATVACRLWSS